MGLFTCRVRRDFERAEPVDSLSICLIRQLPRDVELIVKRINTPLS